MDELLVGAQGDSTIQYVEMVFQDSSQNLWGPQGGEINSRARLTFHSPDGSLIGEFFFPSNPPALSFDFTKNGFPVLIGTQSFVTATGLNVDFVMPPMASPVSGMVCFTNNPASPFFPVNHCLSYGAFSGGEQSDCGSPAPNICCFSPTLNGPPAAAIPFPGSSEPQSLTRFQDLSTDFECGHENSNFRLENASPVNAAGETFEFESGAELGETLFTQETFDGNGRTCSTCHTVVDSFGLSPTTIDELLVSDPTNPLFVAKLVPALAELENQCLMEGGRALILENIDGFENDPVFRNSPHLLNLADTAPYGLSGEFADLQSFSEGAVRQHFTQTLARNTDSGSGPVDFREPTTEELEALEAFMNTIRFPRDGNLDLDRMIDAHILENGADPAAISRGRDLFFGDEAQCSRCHDGPTLSNADGSLGLGTGNESFNTGVDQLPQSLVDDGCIGGPGDPTAGLPPEDGGARLFSTPPLVGIARTAPFFHDSAIGTLQEAVLFYDSATFRASSASALLPSDIVINFQDSLDITAFLEAISFDPADAIPENLVIAVFDNGTFVDTANNSNAESDTVQAALVELGHTVETFIGITAADFDAAAQTSNLILIPELETGNLAAALSADAIASLRSFVEGGGGVAVMGAANNDVLFINAAFGTSVSRGFGTLIALDSIAAAGTLFEGGASILPNLTTTTSMTPATLPPGTLALYGSGTGIQVWLAPIGSGQVGFIGWSWFNGPPLGTAAEGGWADVLDAMVRTLAGEAVPNETIDASSGFPTTLFGSPTSTIATPLPISLQAAVPGADATPLIGRTLPFDVDVSLSRGVFEFPLLDVADVAIGFALKVGTSAAWTVERTAGSIGGTSLRLRFSPGNPVLQITSGELFELAAGAITISDLSADLSSPGDELVVSFEISNTLGEALQAARATVVRAIDGVDIVVPSSVAPLRTGSDGIFYRSEDMMIAVSGVCVGFPNGGLTTSVNCIDPTHFAMSPANDTVVVTVASPDLAQVLQAPGAAISLTSGEVCNPADELDRFDGPLAEGQTSFELVSPALSDDEFHLAVCVTGAAIDPDEVILSLNVALEFGSILLTQPESEDATLTLSARCFGDLNNDRIVNNADVRLLLGCFPCLGPGCDPQCDANFDGNVNNIDFLSFRQNFGKVCSGTAYPALSDLMLFGEPTRLLAGSASLLILLVAGGQLLQRRRESQDARSSQ